MPLQTIIIIIILMIYVIYIQLKIIIKFNEKQKKNNKLQMKNVISYTKTDVWKMSK